MCHVDNENHTNYYVELGVWKSIIDQFLINYIRSQQFQTFNFIIAYSTNIQGGAKNGAILSHCKYSENFMTELRGNW